jgi:hypothetical protein
LLSTYVLPLLQNSPHFTGIAHSSSDRDNYLYPCEKFYVDYEQQAYRGYLSEAKEASYCSQYQLDQTVLSFHIFQNDTYPETHYRTAVVHWKFFDEREDVDSVQSTIQHYRGGVVRAMERYGSAVGFAQVVSRFAGKKRLERHSNPERDQRESRILEE